MKVVLYKATGRGIDHQERKQVSAVRGSHSTDKVILEYHNEEGEKVNEVEVENVDTYHITEE